MLMSMPILRFHGQQKGTLLFFRLWIVAAFLFQEQAGGAQHLVLRSSRFPLQEGDSPAPVDKGLLGALVNLGAISATGSFSEGARLSSTALVRVCVAGLDHVVDGWRCPRGE